MLSPIANFHHSKLPKPGEIGYLVSGHEHWTGKPLFWHGQKQRVIVESYPLCDTPPAKLKCWCGGSYMYYSYGIHTATFRYLGSGERVRMSGFYFTRQEDL